MELDRAALLDMDPETLRGTAACYGLEADELNDDELFCVFADLLDDLRTDHE